MGGLAALVPVAGNPFLVVRDLVTLNRGCLPAVGGWGGQGGNQYAGPSNLALRRLVAHWEATPSLAHGRVM